MYLCGGVFLVGAGGLGVCYLPASASEVVEGLPPEPGGV